MSTARFDIGQSVKVLPTGKLGTVTRVTGGIVYVYVPNNGRTVPMLSQHLEPQQPVLTTDRDRVMTGAADNGWILQHNGRYTRGTVSIRPDYYADGRLYSVDRIDTVGNAYVVKSAFGKEAVLAAIKWLSADVEA